MITELSIIIPIYNGEKYINDCVKQITENISCASYEIILVDDGSTDNTKKCCLKQVSDKVRYFYQENSGVSNARNYGINKSRGKWICFVDIDDFFKFKFSLNDIDEETEIIVFSSSLEKTIEYYLNDEEIKCQIVYGAMGNSRITQFNKVYLNAVWSKAYKADFLKKTNVLFNPLLVNGEDELFNIDLLLRAKKILFVKECVYEWRVNQGSATRRFQEKIIESDSVFLLTLYEILNKNNLYFEMKDVFGQLTLNGLWLVLYLNLGHFQNHKTSKEKYLIYMKLIKQFPYNKYIFISNKKELGVTYKRRFIFVLLKLKLYIFAFALLSLISSKKNNIEERLVAI